MAVYDRWHKYEKQPDGNKKKVPSNEYGKGKRWLVRWRDPDGTPRKLSFDKKADADKEDARIKHELATYRYIDPERGKITLREFSEVWLRSRTVDSSTYRSYERALRIHILPKLGSYSLSVLSQTPSLIQTWISEFRCAPLSVRKYREVLSSILSFAIDDRRIVQNPCQSRNVKSPRQPKKKIIPLTEPQIRALADTDRLGLPVYLGVGLGLRQGEIFGLAIEDIDLDNSIAHIRRQVAHDDRHFFFKLPKGGKERDIPIPKFLAGVLSIYKELDEAREFTLPFGGPEEDLVTARLLIYNRRGRLYRRDKFNQIWKAAVLRSGIISKWDRRYGCHILRHTYASRLLGNGMDMRTLAQLLGHEDPAFTAQTYTHFLPDRADIHKAHIDALFS